MLIRKPKYFDEFKCLAGECPKTCCAGWAVVVDENAREKYNSMESALGQRIRSEMLEDEGEYIFPLKNGRCPFLNDANLCDIQAATDEATLCKTCRMFPRFEYEFGLLRETGLSLSCPEAARLIMRSGSSDEAAGSGAPDYSSAVSDGFDGMKLIEEQTDEGITQYNDIDPEQYMKLTKLRSDLFEMLQDGEISLFDKVERIVKMAVELIDATDELHEVHADGLQEKYFVQKCLQICQHLESIDDEWERLCAELDELRGNERVVACQVITEEAEKELENILFYYVYRYFLSAVFDGNEVGKLLISVFCFYIILSAYTIRQPQTAAERMELVCNISREVEHSQTNLDIIERELQY